MNWPEKLPINREEDYHTHYLGTCSGGRLFWGYETFFYPETSKGAEDLLKHRRDYNVLHLFDSEGNHIDTKASFVGIAAEVDHATANDLLEKWVEELGEVEYADIEVKLFQVNVDGIEFGLVPDEESEMIELQPSSTIAFQEPWDGEYYT